MTETSTRRLYAELLDTAVCSAKPELFVEPDHAESPRARRLREQAAAWLCLQCQAYTTCLTYALRTRPEHGIYAGYTPEEIAVLADTPPKAA